MPKKAAKTEVAPAAIKYLPCGVDLGLDGGLVALHDGKPCLVFKTPSRRAKIFQVKKTKKDIYETSTSRVYDRVELSRLLNSLQATAHQLGYAGPMVMLENYTIRTGLSHPKSYISTGAGLGMWQDVMLELGIPFLMVSPITWKSSLDLSSSKELSLATAEAFFGKDTDPLVLKDHNIAEAGLLGHWFYTTPKFTPLLAGQDAQVLQPIGRLSKKKASK